MAAVTIYLGVVVVILLYAFFKNCRRTLRPGEPPIAPGHFLWGNSQQFAEHAVKFLLSARKQCGEVFTVRFLHQHFTFIMDIHSYDLFTKEKNFSFDAIQEQVNHNVFGFKLVEARKMIGEAGQKVNGKHLFTSLENFAKNLTVALKETASEMNIVTKDKTSINNNKNMRNTMSTQDFHGTKEGNNSGHNDISRFISYQPVIEQPQDLKDFASDDHWCQDQLRNFASKTFFSPVFYSIFGRGECGLEGNFHPQVFHKTFDKFHKYFNFLWFGVPIQMFPKAVEAAGILAQQPLSAEMIEREGCSEYIKHATEFMLRHNQSERDIICHNLVFLHVNYNTFRAVYWCVYKLMEDPDIMAGIRKEVDDAIQAKRTGANEDEYEAEFTTEDINKLHIVDSFLKEVFRWTSGVFMIRKCMEDTQFTTASGETHLIRKGDRVTMYPPAIHHDPEIFEDPETFKYDRFVDAEFYKDGKKIKHPLIGYGYLCPGQRLSQFQIKWFLINLVNSFKLELVEGEKTAPNTRLYGQEILPPVNDVRCRFKERQGACTLKYVNTYGSH